MNAYYEKRWIACSYGGHLLRTETYVMQMLNNRSENFVCIAARCGTRHVGRESLVFEGFISGFQELGGT
jgi:hypothetical protein